jgi:hypothetical protein
MLLYVLRAAASASADRIDGRTAGGLIRKLIRVAPAERLVSRTEHVLDARLGWCPVPLSELNPLPFSAYGLLPHSGWER